MPGDDSQRPYLPVPAKSRDPAPDPPASSAGERHGPSERRVALSLVKSSRLAHYHMCRSWRRDTTDIAWACRNLLELSVFAKYVAQSPANLMRFVEDAGAGESHTATALLKLVENAPTSEAGEKAKQALLATVAVMRSASSF